jgi:hypothetical protein
VLPPLGKDCVKRRTNPPTGRLGCFHFGLWKRGTGSAQSPNRKVGDLSLWPTIRTGSVASRNLPNGRLGFTLADTKRLGPFATVHCVLAL